MSRFPVWLRRKTPSLGQSLWVRNLLKSQGLHTVCQSARCPNLMECFSRGTATFLILGNICSRRCRFCAITSGIPEPPDAGEPDRIVQFIQQLKLRHVVITSVTRDDRPDGGSKQFALTITALRRARYQNGAGRITPTITIEVLTPDFQGREQSLREVLSAGPDIFNHNVETVPRLYHLIRPGADYQRSLNLLRLAKRDYPDIITKSGLMLGLGEEMPEVISTLRDLRSVGCEMVTLGQYLKPSKDERCLDVVRFVPPEEFSHYKEVAITLGFKSVASAPFVRSSYQAESLFSALPYPAR